MAADFFQQVVTDVPFFEEAMVLIVSLLLTKIAPLPRRLQPMVWLGLIATEFASKVNRAERGASQQMNAGLMAACMLILPFWTILIFLQQLAAYPWFFDFIILYTCLNDDHFIHLAHEVKQTIERQERTRARTLLMPYLSRDTLQLNEVGLCKASIEKLVTAPVYGIVTCILFFVFAGAPLVLAARMVKQLELSWPAINPQYRYFGAPIYWLSVVMFAIPSWLWNLSLAIQGGPASLCGLFKPIITSQPIYNCLNTFSVAANVLGTELGGPMTFNGTRVDMTKLTYGPKPSPQTITAAIKLTHISYALWLGLVIFTPVIWVIVAYLKT